MFVRLKGRTSIVREYNALVDTGAEYCIIPKVDAYALGYQEAANDDPVAPADNTTTIVSYDGYAKAALIEMAQVEVGKTTFRKVEFLAFDTPQVAGFDVVLGRSLLQFMKLEIDYGGGQVKMEMSKSGAGH